MSRYNQIGRVATRVYTENGITKVMYHDTIVISFNDKSIQLNTNGWHTVTTKRRINQASNQYNLGIGVYQSEGNWYVSKGDKVILFIDNMIIPR